MNVSPININNNYNRPSFGSKVILTKSAIDTIIENGHYSYPDSLTLKAVKEQIKALENNGHNNLVEIDVDKEFDDDFIDIRVYSTAKKDSKSIRDTLFNYLDQKPEDFDLIKKYNKIYKRLLRANKKSV